MSGRRSDWRRRYPPLLGAVVATVMAGLVLPSALNVPQSNPSQTLEFAPVPPQDDQPPPPDSGNTASLGLGSSDTVPGDATGGATAGPRDLPPPTVPAGVGERPVTKRCVGNPPRQTEDPMSPPCVAHFEGDNFGATYQGVTRDQITVIVRLLGDSYYESSRGIEHHPVGYDDLGEPPADDEPIRSRALRAGQRYFNSRYQLYGRSLRIVVYYFGPGGASVEGQRADAAEQVETYAPFAVFSGAPAYVEAMVQRGVMHFGSRVGAPASRYREFPGLMWGYQPSLEQSARLYVDFVCSKIVPHPASFSGQAYLGQPRRLGLLHPEAEQYPDLAHYADLVREQVVECGGQIVDERTFPVANRLNGSRRNADGSIDDNREVALPNMLSFQENRVTTVLWTPGWETRHTGAAEQIGYVPEWVFAGDTFHEGNNNGAFQDGQQVMDEHAFVITPVALTTTVTETYCYQALSEAAPSMTHDEKSYECNFFTNYQDLRQLAIGTQVAGPRLTPRTVEQGLRAIPAVRSTDPRTPACFYVPGDYTCVKDGAIEWYDAQGSPSNTPRPGCWRMVDGGQRYFAGDLPPGDPLDQKSPDDFCNDFAGQMPNHL